MDIIIETTEKTDLNAILLLQKNCYMSEAELIDDYEIPPLKQDLQSLEKDLSEQVILKGQLDGKIIASVRAYSKGTTCFIGRLIVGSEYQNMGLGRRMMESIEMLYKQCNRFELFTGEKSIKNLYLYNKLEYKEFKREKINEKLTLIYLEKLKSSI